MVRWLSWFASMRLIDLIRIGWHLGWLSKQGICKQLTILGNVDLVFDLVLVFSVSSFSLSSVPWSSRVMIPEEAKKSLSPSDESTFHRLTGRCARWKDVTLIIRGSRTLGRHAYQSSMCSISISVTGLLGQRLHKVLVVGQSKTRKRLLLGPTSKSATLPSDRALHLGVTHVPFTDVLSATPCFLC